MRYWETEEFRTLKRELGNTRLAGTIVRDGCKTLVEFCEKHDTLSMLRLPEFGACVAPGRALPCGESRDRAA
jgi:hypothetical protein